MNISEIQITLNRILKYNKHLDEEGLKFLLSASDWSDGEVRDALFLFKNRDKISSPKEEVVLQTTETKVIDVVKEETKVENLVIETVKEEVKTETVINNVLEVKADPNSLSYFRNNIVPVSEVTKKIIVKEKSEIITEPKLEIKNENTLLNTAEATPNHLLKEEEMLSSAEISFDHLLNSGINELEISGAKETLEEQELEPQMEDYKKLREKILEEKMEAIIENNKFFSLVKDLPNIEKRKDAIRKILDEKPTISVLPETLPVKPFDSSPHTMHLKDYAGSFFEKEERKNSLGGKEVVDTNKRKYKTIPEKDKKLVRLATLFLIVIILILMYMQGASRI